MPESHFNTRIAQVSKYLEIIAISVLFLYFGKSLFVPLLFGLLISFISYPICKWLELRRIPRSLAIALVMLLIIALFWLLLSIMGYELNAFLKDVPIVADKFEAYSPGIQAWIENNLGLDPEKQSGWMQKIITDLENGLMGTLKSIFSATISTVFMLVMIPIYASLFLYHRSVFVRFLESLVGSRYRDRLHGVLKESIQTYFHFVKGTFFVYLIVGILNSAGLLALGIQHAILYGMLTAFMTIIPYVGIIISASMPVLIALITKDSLWYPAAVILIFTIVQYFEANVIFPRVVGAQLNISTWSTLVGIFAGTILWGVSGMILFIPFLGILKIFTGEIEELSPINILLSRK